MKLVQPGTRWRYPLLVSRGAKAPPTFVTDTIGRDGRFGTMVVQVVSVCARGCHVTVRRPCGDCGAEHEAMVEVGELNDLRQGDEGYEDGMGQRTVHNSHRWDQTTQLCKGCGCALASADAEKPCPKPYKPAARKTREPREP